MRRVPALLALLVLTLGTAGCDLIGDLLEFGFWAIVILVLVIVLAAWLLGRRFSNRGRRGPPPPR